MLRAGKALVALLGGCVCLAAGAVDMPRHAPSDVRAALGWIKSSRDSAGRPFAVVDKKAATIWVFHTSGRLAGHAPALLGSARGDIAAPGAASRSPEALLAHERTTPAGRYTSEPGRNLGGEAIVWFDYASALAIHRVRPGSSYAPRHTRLASASPGDNRVSLGCVVVSEAFYDRVVQPVLGQRRGTVYVLPEAKPVERLLEDWTDG